MVPFVGYNLASQDCEGPLNLGAGREREGAKAVNVENWALILSYF